MRSVVLIVLGVGVAACSGGDDGPAGGSDAPPGIDARVVPEPDGRPDAGPCGGVRFYGEVIDFDSTPAALDPIANATLTPQGVAGCATTTGADGGFDTLSPEGIWRFDLDVPEPYLDGVVVADSGVLLYNPGAPVGLLPYSLRALTPARLAALYDSIGQTMDPSRGDLLVYQSFDHDEITLTSAHGPVLQSEDGVAWALGTTGRYLLFTNVVVGSGTLDLSGTSGATHGVYAVPITARQLTYVSTVTVYL